MIPDNWMEDLLSLLPDPQDFQAGGLRDRRDMWEAFLDLSCPAPRSARQREVLSWISKGVNLKMLPVRHPDQLRAPFRAKKIKCVSTILKRILPSGSRVESYLEGP